MKGHDILEGEYMLLSIIMKTVLIYFFVMIIIKFMGKREIGQLSVFDFAVILIIADILSIGVEKNDPLYFYLLPIVAISVIQKLLAFLMLKVVKLRALIDGKQSNIIVNGVLQLQEMRKQNYNIDDLLVQVRLKDVRSLSEIKDAILETNGQISIFKKTDITVDTEIFPFPIIVSGKIQKENLALVNITEVWVKEEVEKSGKKLEDIIYANYEHQKLFIMETKDTKTKRSKHKNNHN